ncbi:hypothetical protein Taro_040464 [Colocasia esculenta]|uniref:Uncharacterized protein n=1 Tax=Colocasia esculenta TaxID=4460 RepID=A0A843W919_COLES|nr:hypothetical protein [Colocasia esculenta]
MSLQLSGVVWRSSWLGSCGSTTRRTSSSPVRLLRPAQTVHLKPIKGTQAIFHEELSSSGRLEDGKKVPSIISRIEENATCRTVDERRIYRSPCRDRVAVYPATATLPETLLVISYFAYTLGT